MKKTPVDSSSIYSKYSFGEEIYNRLTPNQFLDHLREPGSFAQNIGFVTYGYAPLNWVTKNDVDTLVDRIYDTTKTVCVVNPLSSFLPFHENSCVGREALNLIISFKEKVRYPNFLYSCGKIDSMKAKEIENWWVKNKMNQQIIDKKIKQQ